MRFPKVDLEVNLRALARVDFYNFVNFVPANGLKPLQKVDLFMYTVSHGWKSQPLRQNNVFSSCFCRASILMEHIFLVCVKKSDAWFYISITASDSKSFLQECFFGHCKKIRLRYLMILSIIYDSCDTSWSFMWHESGYQSLKNYHYFISFRNEFLVRNRWNLNICSPELSQNWINN